MLKTQLTKITPIGFKFYQNRTKQEFILFILLRVRTKVNRYSKISITPFLHLEIATS
jgi:hypothetical protein